MIYLMHNWAERVFFRRWSTIKNNLLDADYLAIRLVAIKDN